MTPERKAEIREATEKATKVPWKYTPLLSEKGAGLVWAHATDDDAKFATLARTAVPELLAAIDTLERQAADEYKHGLEDAAKAMQPILRSMISRPEAARRIRSLKSPPVKP